MSFRYESGTRGKHDLPEIMGGGVGLIDYDGDGRLDLFLTQGGPIGGQPGASDPPCRMYHNEGDFKFSDATQIVSAPGPSYAMGVAVADYDADGRDDLLVTGWRGLRLYRNVGGRFEDRTEAAGVGSERWSTSAAFADLDGDDDLDLFVACYADFDPNNPPYCAAPDGRRDYCAPEDLEAQPDLLFRNNGDGTFAEIGKAAGVALPGSRSLGVLIADLVGDRRPDIYVANDGTACRLFENRGALRFVDVAQTSGVALDAEGNALAGMGVDLGDIDGDGRPDLVVGNLLGRGTVGFRSVGAGRWVDSSRTLGLTAATRDVTGFGLALVDLDLDGRPDLIQANGHVLDRARLGVPFAMPTTLLHNASGRFRQSIAMPPALTEKRLGRGVAVGDLDGDDRLDIVVASLDRPPLLLRNESVGGRSIRLELEGRGRSGRNPVGARVTAEAGGRPIVAQCAAGGSYLSASTRALTIGIGDADRIEGVNITWPSGRVDRLGAVTHRRTLRIREGSTPPQ